MKYQWVDYPIAMEAKDGIHHGYGWENHKPYLVCCTYQLE